MNLSQRETPLTDAVIKNDISKVQELAKSPRDVSAKNYLGFDGIEIARYLGRIECLKILAPPLPRSFKVLLKDSTKLITLDQKEYEDCFKIKYLSHLVFGGYRVFKDAATHFSDAYLVNGGLEGILDRYGSEGLTPQLIEDHAGTAEENTLRYLVYREKIEMGFVVPSSIQWIDHEIGYGLFAEAFIEKGDFVGEYIGVVKYGSPAVHRVSGYALKYPNYHPMLFDLDPKLEGNELRFANHSYKPNMAFKFAFNRGIVHSIFFATRDIPKGSELLWNYGVEYWTDIGIPVEL